jgi:hypothetical protein
MTFEQVSEEKDIEYACFAAVAANNVLRVKFYKEERGR